MAKLNAIKLKIGLPVNIDPIEWQNKFEGHISKNVAILWPKTGQRQIGVRTLCMAITWPFPSNFDKRIQSSLSLLKILVFSPIFAPRPHMGNVVPMHSKLPSNCWYMFWPS